MFKKNVFFSIIIEVIELILLNHYYYDYFIIIINSLLFLFSIFICNFTLLFLIKKPIIFIIYWFKNKYADINNRFEKKIHILEYWRKRIKYYVLILIFTILILHLFFAIFIPDETDPNSARYVLSAMIQSQAAIIALVVSLLLVAVQLTASSYSKRTISIVKRNPDFWIVLSSYMLSISFSMIILKLIENDDVHELYISLSIYFTIFTFTILFPFLINALNILKPSSFIQELNNDITQKYIISNKKKYGSNPDDPFYPIMDFFKDSILKHDFDITREILTIIKSKIIKLISSNTDENTLDYFYFHLQKMADFVAQFKKGGIFNEILDIYGDIIIILLNEDTNENIRLKTIDSLQFIGQLAVENKLDYSTEKALKLITKIGQNISRSELEDTIRTRRTILAIGSIGINASKAKLITSVPKAIEYLYILGKCASENEKLNDLTLNIIEFIEYIYLNTVTDDDLQYSTLKSIEALKEISIICTRNNFEIPTIKTAEFILINSTNESILFNISQSFREIGKITIEKDYENSTLKVIELLERIITKNLGKESIASDVSISYLFEIGEVALENQSKFLDPIFKTLKDISHIKLAEKNGSVLIGSIESLKKMGITAIDNSLINYFIEIQYLLLTFGHRAIKLNLFSDFIKVTDSFCELSIFASKKGKEDEFNQIKSSLKELGFFAIHEGLEAEPLKVLDIFGILGSSLWNNNKTNETKEIIWDVVTIANQAIKKENDNVANKAIDIIIDIFSLQYLSFDLDKIEPDNSVINHVLYYEVNALFSIGIVATDNKLGDVSVKISENFCEIFKKMHGKLSEDMIKIFPVMILEIGVLSIKNELNTISEVIAIKLAELAKLDLLAIDELMDEQELFYKSKGIMFNDFLIFKRLCDFYKNNTRLGI